MKISFNKPFLSGREMQYMSQTMSVHNHISGNGYFTKKCHHFFEDKYKFKKVLLTTSCTDALEMAAILINIQQGDEVIVPSFTFVSTANAFVRQGAKIVFVDSEKQTPNIDVNLIERKITKKTKAIVPVHYAGVACDMDKIMSLAEKYNLFVVEDAAQAIDSFYKGKPLGSIGHLGAFSFHETKNISSGEGGLLAINDERFIKRAEIIWEKGTNRAAFFRGEINKYGWVDVGSSFLPSDMIAAFLFAQLENIDRIQNKRKKIWYQYYDLLKPLEEKGVLKLPKIPEYAVNNAHMFYMVCRNIDERSAVISALKQNNISAVFHYQSLYNSDFCKKEYKNMVFRMSDYYQDRLLRLPFYYELTSENIKIIVKVISDFYANIH